MSEDTVQLKCLIHNVHHEIDMEKFSVEWIASGYNSMPKLESGAKNGKHKKVNQGNSIRDIDNKTVRRQGIK